MPTCLQVVILSQVLACEATLGYEDYCNVQLLKFNGTPVNNLRHLTELVEACTETYMRFDLAYQVGSRYGVCLTPTPCQRMHLCVAKSAPASWSLLSGQSI